ncbi:Uncharacterised protein [Orientia tsutsugamushi]|uniref:Uncharacterized protein n=1 Tax=Orientia tsutsugamushi TaxID=784 RepID=A0A2U3QUC1_ORITS|nr:Uncharacterised protein [Orientia tsutsugamushi]
MRRRKQALFNSNRRIQIFKFNTSCIDKSVYLAIITANQKFKGEFL